MNDEFEYRIAAFDHPNQTHSILFKGGKGLESLVKDLTYALGKGANLFSIRIFKREGG